MSSFLNKPKYTIRCSGSAYSDLKEEVADKTSEKAMEQVDAEIGTKDPCSLENNDNHTPSSTQSLPSDLISPTLSPLTDNSSPDRHNRSLDPPWSEFSAPFYSPISSPIQPDRGTIIDALHLERRGFGRDHIGPARPRILFSEIPISEFHRSFYIRSR